MKELPVPVTLAGYQGEYVPRKPILATELVDLERAEVHWPRTLSGRPKKPKPPPTVAASPPPVSSNPPPPSIPPSQ